MMIQPKYSNVKILSSVLEQVMDSVLILFDPEYFQYRVEQLSREENGTDNKVSGTKLYMKSSRTDTD